MIKAIIFQILTYILVGGGIIDIYKHRNSATIVMKIAMDVHFCYYKAAVKNSITVRLSLYIYITQ